ncbi:hypothetical protein DV735_g5373, partial [Chaetothyriales sp. CBS 134920]
MVSSVYPAALRIPFSLAAQAAHDVSGGLNDTPPPSAGGYLDDFREQKFLDVADGRLRAAITVQTVLAVVALLVLASKIASYIRLCHIPGPFLAAVSDIVRFRWVLGRKAHRIHIAVHEQYGDLVRIGPNAVSVGDPREIAQIYGFTGKFKKSDFYSVILPMSKGKILPGLFATQDEGIHSMLKKPIAAIYSMTNLVQFEPAVDSTIRCFCDQLDARFAQPQAPCSFSDWLQYFAFDVIGEITFSSRLGFLETGTDVENIMADIWRFFEYVGPVGQMPWLDRVWVKNPVVSRLRKPGRDFLSRFLAAKAKDPSGTAIPDWAVLAWAQSNITAGSDTTAIFLRTLFYNLLRHPATLAKLRAELDAAAARGQLSEIAAWQQTRQLPYLGACIKEAGRIHPPFGLQLERVVPEGGATISGKFIPQGTIVGMNAWVVHRHAQTFGADADAWNPDRWLGGDNDVDRLKNMDRSLLTFGAGHRSCIGKNISQLEIYKLVPTLLQRYDIALASEAEEWDVQNRWFVAQFNFNVMLKQREQIS